MATSSAPKHDFAPAWLKIPTERQSPVPGSSDSRSRVPRREEPYRPGNPSSLRQRHSSSSSSSSGGDVRRETWDARPHPGPYRHHSLDVDEQYYSGNSPQYSSQLALNRRSSSRHDLRDNLYFNFAYKGYSLYDFSKDLCHNNQPYQSWNNSRTRNSKHKDDGKQDRSDPKLKQNKFDKEFPSLANGDTTASPAVNGGVWSATNGNIKSSHALVTGSRLTSLTSTSSPGAKGTSMLTKASSLKQRLVYQPRTLPDKKREVKTEQKEDVEENSKDGPTNMQNGEASCSNGVDGQTSDDMPESNNIGEKSTDSKNMSISNGIDIPRTANGLDVPSPTLDDEGKCVLSSSLEAEQRLLREMGWKDEASDDENTYAPLTEDEINELESLTKKMGQYRNGTTRNVVFNWSPRRLPHFMASKIPLEDESDITSDTDSD